MNAFDWVRTLLGRVPAERTPPVIDSKEFDQDPLPGPGRPIIMPDAAVERPRLFDYEYNLNANFQPRSEYRFIPSFYHLHSFYLLNDETRIAAAYNTDQITAIPWDIGPRPEWRGRYSKDRMAAARRLVEFPDPLVGWNYEQWMRAANQERIVTDALTIYPLRSMGGDMIGFQLIDGQTIKPILSVKGGRPIPPDPAYMQFIHGRPYSAFTLSELIYHPFRPRIWCAYGESLVEEMMTLMARLSLHGKYTTDYFTEGNIPEAVALLDKEWKGDMKKLRELQEVWDELAGMNSAKRRVKQAPQMVSDIKLLKEFNFQKELPEWQVRFICVQFGVSPALFVSETNRATAEELSSTLVDVRMRHTLMGYKRLWDRLLEEAGFPEFEFAFRQPRDFSQNAIAGIVQLFTAANPAGETLLTLQEGRRELGIEESIEDPEGSMDDLSPEPQASVGTDVAVETGAGATAIPAPPSGPPPVNPAPAPVAPPAAPGAVAAPAQPGPVTAIASVTTPGIDKAGGGAPKAKNLTPQQIKIEAGKMAAARARMAAKFLKGVKPVLASMEKEAVDRAIKAARARGKTVI